MKTSFSNYFFLLIMLSWTFSCKSNSQEIATTSKYMDKTLSIFENLVKVEVYDPGTYGITLELAKVSGDQIPPTINIAQAFSNEVNAESFVAIVIVPDTNTENTDLDFRDSLGRILGGILYKIESDTMRASFYTVENGKEVLDPALSGKTAKLDMPGIYDVVHAKFPQAERMILLIETDKVRTYENQKFEFDREVENYM